MIINLLSCSKIIMYMDTMKIGHTNSRGSKDYFLKVLAAFDALF